MQSWRVHIANHPRFGPYYRRIDGQPSWVLKAALAAAVIVIVVPIVLLTLAAIVIGVVVFSLLSLVTGISRAVAGLFGGRADPTPAHPPVDRGRENVRVIRD